MPLGAASSSALANFGSRRGSIISATSGVRMNSAPASRARRISVETASILGSTSGPAETWMQATVTRSAIIGSFRRPVSGGELTVQLPGLVQRVGLVAPADMLPIDENLRHRGASAGPLDPL